MLANASAIDRNSTDYYPTPENVTFALIDYLNIKPSTIWEPACGEGHMAEAIIKRGHRVVSSDLNWQGYGIANMDFLSADLPECDWIITNPPFKFAEQFIERCIDHGKPFALLLKSQYWHSSKRRSLFERHKPIAVLPLTWRPDFHFGAKGGSPTMECAWTVWGEQPSQTTWYTPLPRPEKQQNVVTCQQATMEFSL
jgi:hypothetical protein